MEKLLRHLFQTLGRSQAANRLAKRYGLRLGAGRFVAGETLKQSIEAVRRLNERGLIATVDHLGEFVSTEEEARLSAEMCLHTLDAIDKAGVQSNLSLKLTSLGLDLNRELCKQSMKLIVERAKSYGNFVRIDMEDYVHCQPTLDLYRELREQYDNVGVVVQAYLYRTEEDVRSLSELQANLRLVKGAYKESPDVAFSDKRDVDDNFKRLIRLQLEGGGYAAIATHDEQIVAYAKEAVKELAIPNGRFEFQMLYGIAEELQSRLVDEGYRVRVYVPFGVDWFGYFMRRLAERPANVWFVLKHMMRTTRPGKGS
ncbi:proline dehydrogenase [Paenibacillus sp. YYML68]|uniref:proline dehydrogenase n=1 Tax=Paenibacillus sp. YYML68 TaxID=2909250 RepID=UPI002492A2FF|nr:proline dehydrogenase [Paenibacillus sp. YYML68]